ncbi:MAG: alpha/beta hydrolase [Myxococcales bacterium]|nr:alpha/beta hydrolase [Myxococcales bacterium]
MRRAARGLDPEPTGQTAQTGQTGQRVRAALATAMFALSATGCLSFHSGPMPGEPKGATFASVAGARVRYTDTAAGDEAEKKKPPVVLVHGFAATLETWTAVVPVLRRTHRVIALDLKGFGWTDRPEGDYSPDAEARLVLGLMTHLGVARAAVVGHSWGASVTLAAAMAAPERVERIAIYDPWAYEEQLPLFFHWARADGVGEALFGAYYTQRAEDRLTLAFFDKKYVTEELVSSVEAALERPGTKASALAAVRGQRYALVEDRYRTITQRALVMIGREDGVTLLKYGERLSRDLRNSRLIVYPQCGHFPMIEAAAASTRDLHAFLLEGAPQEPSSRVAPETAAP